MRQGRQSNLEFLTSVAHRWRAVGSASAAFLARTTNATLSYLSSILYARILNIEDFSSVISWTSFANLSAILLAVGVPTYVSREISRARANQRSAVLTAQFVFGTRMCFASAIVLVGIGFGFSNFVAFRAGSDQKLLPFLSFCSSAISIFAAYYAAVILAFDRVKSSLWLSTTPLLVTTSAAALIYFLKIPTAAVGIAVLALGGFLVAALVGRLLAKSETNAFASAAALTVSPSYISWLGRSAAIGINQVLASSLTQVDILLLGRVGAAEDTSMYFAASRLAFITTFFFVATASIIGPRISFLSAEADRSRLEKYCRDMALLSFIVAALIALFVVIARNQLLALFGDQFVLASPLLLTLTLGWLLSLGFGFSQIVLVMTGFEKDASTVLVSTLSINVVGDLLVIPTFGAYGVSWVAVASMIWMASLSSFAVRRRLGLKIDVISALRARS